MQIRKERTRQRRSRIRGNEEMSKKEKSNAEGEENRSSTKNETLPSTQQDKLPDEKHSTWRPHTTC